MVVVATFTRCLVQDDEDVQALCMRGNQDPVHHALGERARLPTKTGDKRQDHHKIMSVVL